jgi:hypothetical protein
MARENSRVDELRLHVVTCAPPHRSDLPLYSFSLVEAVFPFVFVGLALRYSLVCWCESPAVPEELQRRTVFIRLLHCHCRCRASWRCISGWWSTAAAAAALPGVENYYDELPQYDAECRSFHSRPCSQACQVVYHCALSVVRDVSSFSWLELFFPASVWPHEHCRGNARRCKAPAVTVAGCLRLSPARCAPPLPSLSSLL